MRVKCHRISKIYRTKNGPIPAIENVSFQTDELEFLCILGPSGCGKTTLLRLIAGLLEPTSGTILFEGGKSTKGPATALVFQEHGVFPWMNVIDNVCFSQEIQGIDKKTRYRTAMPVLKRMGLDSFIGNYPNQLSAGMKQRVGLARALISGTDIMLMDEPFAALDAQMRLILQEEVLELYTEYHKSVIYVTHDIEEAVLLADRVILMTARPGQIKDEIRINLDRPRSIDGQYASQLIEIKSGIWQQIKEEVERSTQPGTS